jgi:hypothetical protein
MCLSLAAAALATRLLVPLYRVLAALFGLAAVEVSVEMFCKATKKEAQLLTLTIAAITLLKAQPR